MKFVIFSIVISEIRVRIQLERMQMDIGEDTYNSIIPILKLN